MLHRRSASTKTSVATMNENHYVNEDMFLMFFFSLKSYIKKYVHKKIKVAHVQSVYT